MAGALTQSNSNLINYNKMAEGNINRIHYISLAGDETQSIELYLVFTKGGDNLHRIPPPQKKDVNISPVTFRTEDFLFCLGK